MLAASCSSWGPCCKKALRPELLGAVLLLMASEQGRARGPSSLHTHAQGDGEQSRPRPLSSLRYLVLVQEHVQLLDADPQVSLVELVRNVPAQGPEFPSLLYQSVEEAEAVQQLLEFGLEWEDMAPPHSSPLPLHCTDHS